MVKRASSPGNRRGRQPTWWVALLRGINVGGNKKVPMADLRALAAGLGFARIATHVQSGNLVFAANVTAPVAEAALERAIGRHFGFGVPVIVCSGAAWLRHAARSPFPDAEAARPNLLHLALAKQPPPAGVARALREYCRDGERVEVRGPAIWIDFGGGVAGSKLGSAVLDRLVGSTVTARNWRTVQAIAELVRAGGAV